MQLILYEYASNNFNVRTNHDILGYVDKDTENYSNGSVSQPETISNADIYDNWEDQFMARRENVNKVLEDNYIYISHLDEGFQF